MKQKWPILIILIFALGVGFLWSNLSVEPTEDEPEPAIEGEIMSPKPMILEKGKRYQAKLTTSAGEIVIELNTEKTPITANNFISLAKEGFYDGTVFHRTIPGFMIQGGDPEGTGAGGPGYDFDDEPFEGEYVKGAVAMANRGPNTNGSQFFIMHEDYALPKNYVIFGQVIEGLETVDKIATASTQPNSMGENSTPVEPVIVEKIEIVER